MIDGFYGRKKNTSSCASCRFSEYKINASGFEYVCHHPESDRYITDCPIDAMEE